MAQDPKWVLIEVGEVGDGVVVEVTEVVALMVVGDGAAPAEDPPGLMHRPLVLAGGR